MNSVLITGGTGSLGNALVPKLLARGVTRVCIYSRSEKDQAAMRRMYPHANLRWFIGDVRERDTLRRAIEGCDTVIHAAALKRIEVGVYNPGQMFRTNIWGSENVAEASRDAGASKVMLISTDKAVQPVSPYGVSKLAAESLFLAANDHYSATGTRLSVVRYGNVWCSNGSVVPLWRYIVRSGAIPTITDPECTRFFMTLDEASTFVINALRVMRGGEVSVPELPAYRLGDVAEAMGINPIVTGLPKHEKLHEIMTLGGISSNEAERMTIEQIRNHLNG